MIEKLKVASNEDGQMDFSGIGFEEIMNLEKKDLDLLAKNIRIRLKNDKKTFDEILESYNLP